MRSRLLPLVVLAASLLGAAVSFVVLAALSFNGGYDWPEKALVPVDGIPTAIATEPGARMVVWSDESTIAPRCEVDVATQPAEDPLIREIGGFSAGDWRAMLTFTADAERTTLRCALPSGTTVPGLEVAVGTDPLLPHPLQAFGTLGWIPVALLGIALLALVHLVTGAAIRRRSAPPGS